MRAALAFLSTAPGEVAAAAGDLRRLAVPPEGAGAFYAPDFRLRDPAPWWVPEGEGPATRPVRTFVEKFSRADRDGPAPVWDAPDESMFERAFRSLERAFASGALVKGVPVTRSSATWPEDEAAPLFEKLVARVATLPDGLHAYGLLAPARDDKGTTFVIGASPEVLFECRARGAIRTEAVAGTRSLPSGSPELLSDPRIREEHGRVVEDLVERLSRWGSPKTTEPLPRAFGTLEHLVSEVRSDAGCDAAFEDIARHLHPTGALGTVPRGAAGDRWLDAMDPRGARGPFGAPFGFRRPDGTGRCLVAIRGVRYLGGRLEIWAGCGVVPRSRYEDEWREACDKIDAVRSLWGL